ncbi:protein cholesin isoform X2 [Denticeps clupeoides]|uniref:protein cholesin isoform X2 n=1 Tax=Denticeps clupeoides TaxID=299321 RepID=UPI0010A59C4B|nr:uncharacterized protein C7orf50 homolog isoform X2 [Denticeps clupeoides]
MAKDVQVLDSGAKPARILNKTEQPESKKKKKKKDPEIIEDEGSLPGSPEQRRQVEGEEDLSPEERRVLERKMKKILKKEEKKRLKEQGIRPKKHEKVTAAQQALQYLRCWHANRDEWRFQKTRQTWLLRHMYDPDQVADDIFSVLLLYLEDLRGAARDLTVQKAESLVREEEGADPDDPETQRRIQRAREICQLLS